MSKTLVILAVLSVYLIAESSCRFIRPTYRPPPPTTKSWIFRARRGADDQPLWLNQGDDVPRAPSTADHPVLPSIIDDIKLDPNRRTVRSLSTPSVSRGGGSGQSSSRDTGATHPGYNRRNAREIRYTLPTLPRKPPTNYPWDQEPVGRIPFNERAG